MGNGFPVSGVVTTPSVNDLHEKKAPPHYNTVSTQSQSTHTMPYHLYNHVLTYTCVFVHVYHSSTEFSCVNVFFGVSLRVNPMCTTHIIQYLVVCI